MVIQKNEEKTEEGKNRNMKEEKNWKGDRDVLKVPSRFWAWVTPRIAALSEG